MLNSSCFAGPIIEKSFTFSAEIKNCSIAFVSNFASGFKINANLVLTFDNPKLLPFA